MTWRLRIDPGMKTLSSRCSDIAGATYDTLVYIWGLFRGVNVWIILSLAFRHTCHPPSTPTVPITGLWLLVKVFSFAALIWKDHIESNVAQVISI